MNNVKNLFMGVGFAAITTLSHVLQAAMLV